MRTLLIAIAALSLALVGLQAGRAMDKPAPQEAKPAMTATAVFAGGCFWCTESDFEKLPGVIDAISGYTGGHVGNPSYEQVSAGGTGHVEAVKVIYDPAKLTTPSSSTGSGATSIPPTPAASSSTAAPSTRARSSTPTTNRRSWPKPPRRSSKPRGASQADRHQDRAARPLLSGRGIPPELLQEKPHPLPLLPLALGPRPVFGEGLGEGRQQAPRRPR